MIGALVIAALVGLVAVIDIVDVSSRFSDLEGLEVSVGIGLWLVLLGALAGVAGAVIALATPKTSAPAG